MPPSRPTPSEEMAARLERALADSPADETEIVWLEARRTQESTGKRRQDGFDEQERTLLVRVRESGRTGLHRTGSGEPAEIGKAVREALAQARLAAPSPPPVFPPEAHLPPAPPGTGGLADPELVRMTPGRARDLIQRLAERTEQAQLGWAEGSLVVASSRGIRRSAEMTSAWISVSCSRSPGAGRAQAVARSLDGLDAPAVFERARSVHAPGGDPQDLAEPPDGPVPAVLSPEAAAGLIDFLNRQALTSTSFSHGALRERLGAPAFHPGFSLRDDGTDPRSVPLPFDLLGSARRPVDLVERGVLLTPAVDDRLAAAIDRPPTPHLVAPDEARASHLFLLPGELPDGELLGRAAGGVWMGALEAIEGFDPGTLRFRAIARGVRRLGRLSHLEEGALGAPVPDLVWEDDLQVLLTRLLGVGRRTVAVPTGDPLFGATTAPSLAFEEIRGLRPAPTPRS